MVQRVADGWKLVSAAVGGDPDACCALGILYNRGFDVGRDAAQAVLWFHRAAEHGSRYAQVQLGLHHDAGIGVERSPQQALRWWVLAAKSGSADAHYYLGVKYFYGRGVVADPVEAGARFIVAAICDDRFAEAAWNRVAEDLSTEQRDAACRRARVLLPPASQGVFDWPGGV